MTDFVSGGVPTYGRGIHPSLLAAGDTASCAAADLLTALDDMGAYTLRYDVMAIIHPDGTVERRPEGFGGVTWFGGSGTAGE